MTEKDYVLMGAILFLFIIVVWYTIKHPHCISCDKCDRHNCVNRIKPKSEENKKNSK